MMRTLYYTAQNATAQQLHQFGSVYRVVPREELLDAALDVARNIAKKDTASSAARRRRSMGSTPST